MRSASFIIFTISLLVSRLSFAQPSDEMFPIVSSGQATALLIDERDAKVVHIASSLLAEDVKKITGQSMQVQQKPKTSPHLIIAGTLGKNQWIDAMVKSQKLTAGNLKGQWEQFSIELVDSPIKGVEKALVVVGSDRRGTAYGILELSRMMGVSPWEWWADVTPEKRDEVTLDIEKRSYGSPSVKYRGIFLNDEDWGLQRWAAHNYEPETGDIGPKTYAKVFELLLRLRANTIWPAMHSSTKAFYFYPENKVVADDYAIVIGTSHAEPMLSNINTEWDHATMGDYRYDTNAETIKGLFTKRVKETAKYEGIYTTGMRGEHDSPMIVGEDDTDSQVKLLEQVISDQRSILKRETGKNPADIPQAFVPYKEVLKYYQSGLDLPEDITLVWTDDNYGYIRQLNSPEEQKRSGGAGVYYHTSYWGRPHDYQWLNSTSPVLMWEEMSKAFELQSRNIWILNCGDIKPHEYNIELFLDMAWNMEEFENGNSVKQHMSNWASREFGSDLSENVVDLLYQNNHLAYIRRPEFMAWSQVEPVTKPGNTEMTQIHYGDEVGRRITDYENLMERAKMVKENIPAHRQDAFYELVYYPIMGAGSLNLKWLYHYKNKFTAKQGRLSADYFGTKSKQAYQDIQDLTTHYNTAIQNGKWSHIMSSSPRFLPVFSEPTVASPLAIAEQAGLGLALEGYEMEVNHDVVNSYADVLPVFNAYTQSKYYVDVFLNGEGAVGWQAVPREDWIQLSQLEGTLSDKPGGQEQRLWVTIDWEKVPQGENKKEAPLGHDFQLIPPSHKVNSAIDFTWADSTVSIGVSVFNPKNEVAYQADFVEDRGFVSINAAEFSRKSKGQDADWQIVEGLGYAGSVMTALPRTASLNVTPADIMTTSPTLEYDFFAFNFGTANVHLQIVPTHAPHVGMGVRYAVAIDDAEPVIVDFQTFGRSEEWKQNVLKNAAVKSAQQIVNRAGKHTLKVWMVDPGVMLDQILIDLGGWKSSYAFPKASKR